MPPHTASPWDADAESDPDALYSPSRVVNLPSYDTKHLDALEYRLRELDTTLTVHQSSTTHSTSSSLWLSAQVLVAYLLQQGKQQQRHPQNSRQTSYPSLPPPPPPPLVVELGAGTGFVSMALACTGRYPRVIATDTSSVVPTLLRENVEANAQRYSEQTRVSAQVLTWLDGEAGVRALLGGEGACRAPSSSPPPTLVLATDTIYAPHLIRPFWTTLRALISNPSSHALIALERRDPALIDEALRVAQSDEYELSLERIDDVDVANAVEASLDWHNADIWDGVEIYEVRAVGARQE